MAVIFKRGNRIDLCVLDESMVPEMCTWINDEEVTQFLTVYLPLNEIFERAWVTKSEPDPKNIPLAIVTKEGTLIGTVGIHNIQHRHQFASFGITIGKKEYWGQGLGTEATMLILDYAFLRLNLRRVILSVYDFNERAHTSYIKCGFKEEGRLKKHRFIGGEWRDEILMAITKKRWKKNRANLP